MALEERQTKGGDELMLLILLSAGLYTAGYFFTFFRIAGQLAWHLAANKDKSETYSYWQSKYGITTVAAPNGEQWAGAITTAFIFSPIWPLSLPVTIGLANSNSKDVSKRSLFYMPNDRRVELQAERIRELERAAGLPR
jgi:hypothetical protein